MPRLPFVRVVRTFRGTPPNLLRTQRLTRFGYGGSVFVSKNKLKIRK